MNTSKKSLSEEVSATVSILQNREKGDHLLSKLSYQWEAHLNGLLNEHRDEPEVFAYLSIYVTTNLLMDTIATVISPESRSQALENCYKYMKDYIDSTEKLPNQPNDN